MGTWFGWCRGRQWCHCGLYDGHVVNGLVGAGADSGAGGHVVNSLVGAGADSGAGRRYGGHVLHPPQRSQPAHQAAHRLP